MRRLAIVGLMAAACACTDASAGFELALGLRTDLVSGEEFDAVQVALFATDGRAFSEFASWNTASQDFQTLTRIGELPNVPPGDYRLEFFLEHHERGFIAADRPLLLSVGETATALNVPITRSCLNVACPPEDDPNTPEDESLHIACFGGRCVDPRCSLDRPEFCGDDLLCSESENQPSGNAACAPLAGCARSSCEAGVCWALPLGRGEGDACSADSAWCHPELGCLPFGASDELRISAELCSNGERDVDEEGIDCGGPCSACALVFSSLVDPQCSNGERDVDEEGIDCGGPCTSCPEVFDCELQQAIPVHECLALVALFEKNGGRRWLNRTGWLSDTSPCDWAGVACGGGHVTGLLLSHGPSGALASELGNLHHLEELDLHSCRLTSLPDELAKLQTLRHLDLGFTTLDVPFPLSLTELSSLETLGIEYTGLAGTIPPEIGKLGNLRVLKLNHTSLSGTMPPEMGALEKLENLNLSTTFLRGPLPQTFGQLSALRELRLSYNDFDAPLPEGIVDLVSLELLLATGAGLTGTIPAGLGSLPQLEWIGMANNRLSGSIPSEFGTASELEVLRLENNQLSGQVPVGFATEPRPRSIRLSDNACLWTFDCASTKAYLDDRNASWSVPRDPDACTPPEGACE